MQRGDVVLGGFLGGAVPYLLGMAHDALVSSAQGEGHLYSSTGYWVGTLLFGVICFFGAVVTAVRGAAEALLYPLPLSTRRLNVW